MGGDMSALSLKRVPSSVFAFLTVFALGGPAAVAQTLQGDYDKAIEQGYTPYDAERRARASETERNTPYEQQIGAGQRSTADPRAAYEKRPPLPAGNNPLLGKWRVLPAERSGLANLDSLLGLAPLMDALNCPTQTYDFRETVSADAAGNAVDQVGYRRGDANNRVAVLGTRGPRLMVFEFVGPDRIRSTFNSQCVYARVGPANATAALSGASPGAQAKAPVRAAGGGIANSGVNFGASIETVRQSLSGRAVSLLPARHMGDRYRLVALGDFSDLDPRIKQMTYEFDAPEGPGAKLTGVVVTYARDGSAQSAVYSERAATLSKKYPLAPQSATKMEASVANTVVSVIDDLTFSQVYEIYRTR